MVEKILLTNIENRDYYEPAAPAEGPEMGARRYRRRLRTNDIDLRNL